MSTAKLPIWNKDSQAQKNLEALVAEGIVPSSMRTKGLKSLSDSRVAEILKYPTSTINQKIQKIANEIKPVPETNSKKISLLNIRNPL